MIVTKDTKCPNEYPDEALYDFWPGSDLFCDCLDREGDKTIGMGRRCSKGKNGKETSSDCWINEAVHPVVQA